MAKEHNFNNHLTKIAEIYVPRMLANDRQINFLEKQMEMSRQITSQSKKKLSAHIGYA